MLIMIVIIFSIHLPWVDRHRIFCVRDWKRRKKVESACTFTWGFRCPHPWESTERQVGWRRDYNLFSIPLLWLVLSGVRTVIEEAGFLRDVAKTLYNNSTVLGLRVLELREKPSLHSYMGPGQLDTLKTDSNIGGRKMALQMNLGIYTWHQQGKG